MSISNILDSMVSISEFNKKAGKVFADLQKDGMKIVIKNNAPVGVLLSPEKYRAINEEIEDLLLYIEATARLSSSSCAGEKVHSHEDVLKSLNIAREDLLNIDVEID